MKYRFALPASLVLVAGPLLAVLTACSATAQTTFTQAPAVEPSRVAGDEEAAESMRDAFVLQPGFQVELLYTVPGGELGSWVSICLDDKGRILASDQGGGGICRITPPTPGTDEETKVEKLDLNITSAQGMLYAFGSLYLSVNGGPGSGLYRARDTNGDDQFDELVLLKALEGGGEHGPHGLRLSPDGQSIYVLCGNHTKLPAGTEESLIPMNWDEDLLLPRQWDARGHAAGILAPGGYVCRTDPDGENWQVVSMGYRNPYDMDFNAEGELFTYDADMEWDLGTPWYRPTRVVHATSGSEFGWRSGTGKWPTWYPDSLPPAVEIGPGSPVGATFGYGAKFPAEYQKSLYILDWTFGTMYAIHFQPEGASYVGTKEEFVARNGLPLTDVVIGNDGALYFTVGGRGTQSALYRVTYVGDESTEPVDCTDSEGRELRELRRRLESFHTMQEQAAIDAALPQLGHEDRFIRYAARIALENQPVERWQNEVLALEDPQALITGMVALARQGSDDLQPQMLEALGKLDYASLSESQKLELLRAYELVFIRMGHPDVETSAELVEILDPLYPAPTDPENRELVQLLVYLDSPTVYGKTLDLMEQETEVSPEAATELLQRNPGYGNTIAAMLANTPEIEKVWYAFVLRNMRYGCTIEERRRYFDWLNSAHQRSGGASYDGFLNNIRNEAIGNMSESERELVLVDDSSGNGLQKYEGDGPVPTPEGPGHDWTMEEVLQLAQNGLRDRNFEHGKRTFEAARCIICHRFDGVGGATGPDLSNVAARFTLQDLLDAIMKPSAVVSDQYQQVSVYTVDGLTITGRIVNRNDEEGTITVWTDPEDPTKSETIKLEDIDPTPEEGIELSSVSLMPDGLLNPLNEEEVLDLLAYLLSRGNAKDRIFATAEEPPADDAATSAPAAEATEEESPTSFESNTAGEVAPLKSAADTTVELYSREAGTILPWIVGFGVICALGVVFWAARQSPRRPRQLMH